MHIFSTFFPLFLSMSCSDAYICESNTDSIINLSSDVAMSLYILMTCKEMSRVFSMSMEMTGLGAFVYILDLLSQAQTWGLEVDSFPSK